MSITSVETQWPDPPPGWSTQDWQAFPAAERGLWQVQDLLVRYGHPVPSGVDASRTAYARLDHGRWIVQCPECSSAQLAASTDPRFYCIECGNSGTGAWLPVIWPDDRLAVETEALGRSGPAVWAHPDDPGLAAQHVRRHIGPPSGAAQSPKRR